jgi:MFS family permease
MKAKWLDWWQEASKSARNSLVAASLGWMLDAFDIMLYSLVLVTLIRDLGISKRTAGWLGSITLIASALGGVFFGLLADRFGRTRALMGSVLIYSVFTGACGLSQTIWQLAICRVFLGLGMGGEWTSGAALVSESWPTRHRGKAMGVMQSFWAIGYAAAAAMAWLILPRFGWRAVFWVGVLPAVFVFWVQKRVDEPAIWSEKRQEAEPRSFFSGIGYIFKPPVLWVTLPVTAMNALTLFSYWGFNSWIPAYLSLPNGQGGMGFSTGRMSMLVIVMQVGTWLGYLTFGFISDRFGRKRVYVFYLVMAALLLLCYSRIHHAGLLLLTGPCVAFFGSGYFSGFGALTAELYPTAVRATAQGFTYNTGRIVSAVAPFTIGLLAEKRNFPLAFVILSASFLLAAAIWSVIPETARRDLE